MSEVKFEPFQHILARVTHSKIWFATLFSHYTDDGEIATSTAHLFSPDAVLPYNDETAHLLGTTDDPTPPEPEFKWGEKVMVHDEIQDGEEPAIYLCETGHAVLPHMVIIKGQKTPCRMKECRRFDWEDAWKN